MKSLITLVLVFLSLTNFASKQLPVDDKRVDSLELLLLSTDDTGKLDLLLELCNHLVEKDAEKCMLYSQQALDLSRQLDLPEKEIQAIIYQGRVNSHLGNYFEGLQKFREAQEMALDKKLDKSLVDAWNEIGITYFNIGQFDEALNYYFKTLKKAEEINYLERVSGSENNIAIIYSIYKDHDKALEWFGKLLAVYHKNEDELHWAMTLVNMANIYDEIGEYDKGIENMKLAIPILTKLDQKQMLATSLCSQGDLLMKKKNKIDSAYLSYQQALEIAEDIQSERGIVVASHNIGRYFVAVKEYEKALVHLKKALNIALKTQDTEHVKDCYEIMANVYTLKENYEKALEYTNLFVVYKDRIYNENTQKLISELQIQYETDKKEHEIELLQVRIKSQKRNLLILLGGLFIISVLVLRVLNLKQVNLKRKNLLLVKEKEMDQLAMQKMEAEAREQELENLRLQEEMKATEEINKLKQLKYEAELQHKERAIATNALHVVSKNELLSSIKQSVEEALVGKQSEMKNALNEVVKGIEHNINLDQDWDNFKMLFEEVHQDFFKRLLELFPDLNSNELRFCAYLRLNLDTKEIARILNVSANAIEKRRYRLRKKLNLKSEDNIFEFLCKF